MPKKWDPGAIKKLRQDLRLTQEELADKVGTERNTVTRWESGVSKPRLLSQRRLDELDKDGESQ